MQHALKDQAVGGVVRRALLARDGQAEAPAHRGGSHRRQQSHVAQARKDPLNPV